MTNDQQPSPTPDQDERRQRLQQLINEGREAELSEEDYQYAIENGLIEG